MPAPPVDYLPFSSLHDDSDDFLGFDEEEDALHPSLDERDEKEIMGIVELFQKGIEEMKDSRKESDSDIFKSSSDHMGTFHDIWNYTACQPECRRNSTYAVSKLLGHFGKAMSFLYNATSQTNSTATATTSSIATSAPPTNESAVSPYAYAAHHFRKVIRASKYPQTQIPFQELNLNATFSALVLDAHFKLSDVYRICQHTKSACPKLQVLNQREGELLESARTALLNSSPLTNHTNRPSDHSSHLRQLYEVSIELYDVGNASSFLDQFLVSSPEKELNSTERSAMLTNLCVFELQRRLYYDARGSCQRAVDLDTSSNTALVMAADLEMLLGNYTFAAVFYDRALKIASDEGGRASSVATAQLSFQLGSALTLLGKHSEAEDYFKMAVGAHLRQKVPVSPLFHDTPSYVHLGKQFLTTKREDQAKGMFEKALELNSKIKNPPPSSPWNFAIGLAYSASNAHNDAQAKYKKVIKRADEAWEGGDSMEYKHLASIVHTLPACPVVDHRVTDRALLALALRKNNATDAAIGKVRLLPEEMEEMEEFEEEDREEEEVEEEEDKEWDIDGYDDEDEIEDEDRTGTNGPTNDRTLKRWIMKPRRGSRGGGLFVGTKDEIKRVVEQQEYMKENHFVASEYVDDAFLTKKGGSPTSLTAYTLLSNSWPLPRVYVHKLSVKVNSAPKTTFFQWIDDLTDGSSEDGFLDEVDINVSGDAFGEDEDQDDLLKKMRHQNLNNLWAQSLRNIASCFESSLKAEVRSFVKMEKKKVKKNKVKKEESKESVAVAALPLWKKYHAESSMCRQRTIYGVDLIISHGNEEKLGLLGEAKTRVIDIDRNVDIESSWKAQENNTMWRTRDTLVMMAGDAVDRSQLELIKNNYIAPDAVVEKKLSNRLSWAIQKLTKELCPLLYKERTEKNIAKDYEQETETNFEEFECDQEKLGYFASELAVATMEYERKVGWVLAYPLKEAKPRRRKQKDGKEVEDMLADGIVVRNLFVKWVRDYEKDKSKKEKKRKRG
ncbi:hypothetical protein TrRE_jg9084 [Triparma retinervis]|uniref:Uncharacterized protein n=1 Tax=Triparma retinervis TaxID=2557542 RepID=A0A9W7DQ39_9STRA|nr:hypothetical protein TrRE_jg9084 [Triparma retinervis]